MNEKEAAIRKRMLFPLVLAPLAGPPTARLHPAYVAELLAPGVVSTRDFERDGTFTPDGLTFYFTKRTIWPYFSAICESSLESGHWSTPKVASFSGQWADATPFISPDGAAIYFASRRPMPNGEAGYHLWAAERAGDDWSEPHPLPDSINAGGAISPAITSDGTLYFLGLQRGAVQRAARSGDSWGAPVAVPGEVSATTAEVTVYVAPDERFMVVGIIGRSDAIHSAEGVYPRSDLYVRERANGEWGPLRHLPAPINSSANEPGQPTLTPDGKFFVFSSERGVFSEHGNKLNMATLERELHTTGNGLGDIYKIDIRALGLTH